MAARAARVKANRQLRVKRLPSLQFFRGKKDRRQIETMSVTTTATATAATPERATAELPAQPPRRGPEIRIRRYGRSDFERFDQEAARGPHLCVGSATIGKVDIDCRYHWKKAQWGVLGHEKTPAGIVYMDITFNQPKGYWLERANVFITLSEDSSSYACYAPRHLTTDPRRPLGADYTVQITEYYGPHLLTGTPTCLAEAKHLSFVPSVGVMGFEFGGIGYESATFKNRVGRWVFKGKVRRPIGCEGLRTLEWELCENELSPEQAHSQVYQTAFAFEHSKRPVFMRVEVQGKLRSRSRQMKHELLRFSSAFARKDYSTLTKLDLGNRVEFKKSLDQAAQGLDLAMQMANCERIPLEVPDPTPAQFIDGVSPGRLQDQTQQSPLRQRPAPGERIDRELEEDSLELQQQDLRCVEGRVTDPIVESLRRQLRDRFGSDIAACIHLEETRRDPETPKEDAVPDRNETTPTKAASPPLEAIEQPVLDIVQIPGLLMILKFIATVLQWVSALQRVQLRQSGKAASGPAHHARLLGENASRSAGETQLGKAVHPFPSPPAVAGGTLRASSS
jgi:hypothetical protein